MKMIFRKNLKAGSLEFNRNAEITSRRITGITTSNYEKHGLLLEQDVSGPTGKEWLVEKNNTMQIKVNPGSAMLQDSNGNYHYISMKDPVIFDIPSNPVDTYWSVILEYKESSKEKGSVSVNNGSTQITGTGTEFDKVFAANRRIFLNGKGYIVESVQSPIQLTLKDSFPDTSVVDSEYSVGGWFTSYPAGESDNLIYVYEGFTLSVANSFFPSGTNILLAEVKTTTSPNISNIIDHRHNNTAVARGIRDYTATYNYIRNGDFRLGSDFEGNLLPFHTDKWEGYHAFGGFPYSTRVNTGGNNQYDNWLGQKIHIGKSLKDYQVFSLGFRYYIGDHSNNFDNLEVSVYAWSKNNEVDYSTITQSGGLTTASNRIAYKTFTDKPSDIKKIYTLEGFKIDLSLDISTLFVQFRVKDNGSGSTLVYMTEVQLVRGKVVREWSPNPEDVIEYRNIGKAAYIVNQLFELLPTGEIVLKTDVYGKNGSSPTPNPILDASSATANGSHQTTSGTQTKVSQYVDYGDNEN